MKYLLVLVAALLALMLTTQVLAGVAAPKDVWTVERPKVNRQGTVIVPGRLWIGGTPIPGVYIYNTHYSPNGQWGVVRLKIYESMYMPVPWSSATTTP